MWVGHYDIKPPYIREVLDFLITFLNVDTRKKKPFSLCKVCTLMPQMTLLLTLTLVHMLYEESTPEHFDLSKSIPRRDKKQPAKNNILYGA